MRERLYFGDSLDPEVVREGEESVDSFSRYINIRRAMEAAAKQQREEADGAENVDDLGSKDNPTEAE